MLSTDLINKHSPLNNGNGCFEIEIWTDTAKFTVIVGLIPSISLYSAKIWSEKVKCLSTSVSQSIR